LTLRSAFEDVQETTLQALSGMLERLRYLSTLRDANGGYAHWGLSRVHGEVAAQKALDEAHRSTMSRVLATPVRRLLDDAVQSSRAAEVSPAQYVEKLRDDGDRLMPADPGAGSARHLSAVLRALSSLIKNRQ
jgi:hypothetical protein